MVLPLILVLFAGVVSSNRSLPGMAMPAEASDTLAEGEQSAPRLLNSHQSENDTGMFGDVSENDV